MRYAEYAPRPALSGVIRCIWVCEDASPAATAQPIVGDGCPELLVHFGAPMLERGEDGCETLQPGAFVAGQLTRPLWLRASGAVGVLGARFHPWAAHRVLRKPLCDFTDRRVAIGEWMEGSEALVASVAGCDTDEARVLVVESFVADRLVKQDAGDDALVAQCVARLEATLSIDSLAKEMQIGRRQLERRFAERVGVSPRALGGILRLRRFFDQLDRDNAPLADAALAAGYYDQSHFAREFRRYAGLTATEFLATRPALASAIFDIPN